MEKFKIKIVMQMMSENWDTFENKVESISKIKIKRKKDKSYCSNDMTEKIREKIYSMIEKEEETMKSYFICGEVTVEHRDEKKIYVIAAQEFADVYNNFDRETYH